MVYFALGTLFVELLLAMMAYNLIGDKEIKEAKKVPFNGFHTPAVSFFRRARGLALTASQNRFGLSHTQLQRNVLWKRER